MKKSAVCVDVSPAVLALIIAAALCVSSLIRLAILSAGLEEEAYAQSLDSAAFSVMGGDAVFVFRDAPREFSA